MQLEAKKYLDDVRRATSLIAEFTAGRPLADYKSHAMLRAAVEREFDIIGEALAQLSRAHGDVACRIREHERIIAFRNILIHGYAEVDDRLVWEIAETKLPALRTEVDALLNER